MEQTEALEKAVVSHANAPNQSMEAITSGRYILLLGSLDRYPVAMRPLARDTYLVLVRPHSPHVRSRRHQVR